MKQKPFKIFFHIFFCFSFKNSRLTNVVLVNIFKNALKKVNNCQKTAKMAFVMANSFFSAFTKIPTKRTFVRLFFFKLNQSQNIKNIFLWFFFKNQKRAFWGSKIVVYKLKFQICFSAFVLLCKRKHHANFHKKILMFRPPGIFENENFAAPERVPKIWIWTSKIMSDLCLSAVFCQTQKKITPP